MMSILNQNKTYLFLSSLLMLTPGVSEALVGTTQQALGTMTAEEMKTPSQSGGADTSKTIIEKFNRRESGLELMIRHPYLSFTPNSVLTPSAAHIQSGALGFSVAGFEGFPTLPKGNHYFGGGATAVLPLGNSDESIGVALSVSEFALEATPSTSGSANGNFALMLNRWLDKNTMIIAGASNLVPWGQAMQNVGHSYYAGLSRLGGFHMHGMLHQVSVSAGIGSGLFAPYGQTNANYQLKSSLDNAVYPFVNASFNLTPKFSIAGDYYSETFALGLSYLSTQALPLSLTAYVGNLRKTELAPALNYGLRIATAFPYA